MKIRNGFVSNSSSSSFIINDNEEFSSVFDIAEYMIPCRDMYENTDELLKRLKESDKHPDTPINFGSCNYDTFIYKHKDIYLVRTCNNHEWGKLDQYPDVEFCNNEDILKKYPELDPNNNGYVDFCTFLEDKEFWSLEMGFMFKETQDWDICMNPGNYSWDDKENVCCGEFYIVMGEKICGTCLLTPDGKKSQYKNYIEREKKINRIIDDI